MSMDDDLPTDDVPVIEADLGDGVPEELDEYGRKVWLSETPAMMRAGRLKATDRTGWMRYCQLVGSYWEAEVIMGDGGRYQDVPTTHQHVKGQLTTMKRIHPAAAHQYKILPELRQLEDRFARSPLARANLVMKGLGGSGAGDLFNSENDGGGAAEAGRPTSPAAFN